MSGLDIFALFVLLILFATAIATWIILGMLPGRIALSRNHSQSEAINIPKPLEDAGISLPSLPHAFSGSLVF